MPLDNDAFQWPGLADFVLVLEARGLVTRTFRRLDPDRQREVIHAILEEGSERGLGAVNIKNVARRAGVSVGSLYQYFGDRAAMIAFTLELCRTYMERILTESEPYLTDLSVEDALTYYILGGYDWAEQQGVPLRFFSRAAYLGDDDLRETLVRPVARIMRGIVAGILRRGIERGELRQDTDLEMWTDLMHTFTIVMGDSAMLPYLEAYYQIRHEDLEARVRGGLALLLQGMKPA